MPHVHHCCIKRTQRASSWGMSISPWLFLTAKRETRPWYSASQYQKLVPVKRLKISMLEYKKFDDIIYCDWHTFGGIRSSLSNASCFTFLFPRQVIPLAFKQIMPCSFDCTHQVYFITWTKAMSEEIMVYPYILRFGPNNVFDYIVKIIVHLLKT